VIELRDVRVKITDINDIMILKYEEIDANDDHRVDELDWEAVKEDAVRQHIENLWCDWAQHPAGRDSGVMVCPLKLAAQTGGLSGGIRSHSGRDS